MRHYIQSRNPFSRRAVSYSGITVNVVEPAILQYWEANNQLDTRVKVGLPQRVDLRGEYHSAEDLFNEIQFVTHGIFWDSSPSDMALVGDRLGSFAHLRTFVNKDGKIPSDEEMSQLNEDFDKVCEGRDVSDDVDYGLYMVTLNVPLESTQGWPLSEHEAELFGLMV